IQDIPFVLCFLMVVPFFWRWPVLYRICSADTGPQLTDWDKRKALAKQSYLALLFDTLAIVFIVILIIFPWRIPSLVRAWRDRYYERTTVCLSVCRSPLFSASALMIVWLWRVRSLLIAQR